MHYLAEATREVDTGEPLFGSRRAQRALSFAAQVASRGGAKGQLVSSAHEWFARWLDEHARVRMKLSAPTKTVTPACAEIRPRRVQLYRLRPGRDPERAPGFSSRIQRRAPSSALGARRETLYARPSLARGRLITYA
jgi:hypothetical protein